MKTLIVGALSAAALLAVAPAANAGSGYVGAAYTRAEVDTGFGDADADGYSIDGAWAFAPSSGLGIQVDAGYADADGSDNETYGVTGHVHARNDKYLFGGFVGLADAADETIWSAGLEGEKYYDNVTLAGAIGYANADDSDADIYGADAQVRYFLSDNFRIQGALGYAKVEAGPADDNVWSAGVGGEYQFASVPVSLFGNYAHSEFDDADVSSDAFTVGVRYNFGGSLKDRDRKGASLAGLSSLISSAF
jgi:hypothetical protein